MPFTSPQRQQLHGALAENPGSMELQAVNKALRG
jgi:hypothetical protein